MGSHKQHSFERKPEKLGSLKREFRICTNVLFDFNQKRKAATHSADYANAKLKVKHEQTFNFQLIFKVFSLSKIVPILKQFMKKISEFGSV